MWVFETAKSNTFWCHTNNEWVPRCLCFRLFCMFVLSFCMFVLCFLLVCSKYLYHEWGSDCPCGCLQPIKEFKNLLSHLLVGVTNMIIDPDNARKSHFIFRSRLKTGIDGAQRSIPTPNLKYQRPRPLTFSSFNIKLPSHIALRFYSIFPLFSYIKTLFWFLLQHNNM